MIPLARIAVAAVMLAIVACTPTRESDKRILASLRAQYGSVADLSIRDGMYLTVRARTDAGVDSATIARIFREFVGDSTIAVESTGIIYLNYYDRRGTFLWQLSRAHGKTWKSRQEFY